MQSVGWREEKGAPGSVRTEKGTSPEIGLAKNTPCGGQGANKERIVGATIGGEKCSPRGWFGGDSGDGSVSGKQALRRGET